MRKEVIVLGSGTFPLPSQKYQYHSLIVSMKLFDKEVNTVQKAWAATKPNADM